jgi:murein DD-endopeptidase MepM/ murein hydrolase activator NlpD
MHRLSKLRARLLAAAALVCAALALLPVADAAPRALTTLEWVAVATDVMALPTPLPPAHRHLHAAVRHHRRSEARASQAFAAAIEPPPGRLLVPVGGRIPDCGWFGCPRPGHLHAGLDIAAPEGTPVVAAADGVVASVQMPDESGGYGLFICIQHAPDLATCYAHLSAWILGVKPGAAVRAGQPIGLVGQTGHATGPHLHFEVRRGSATCRACVVDPYPLFYASR